MTIFKIIIASIAALFICAFFIAIWGLLSTDPNYIPMTPDEEYRWLTEDIGLTHEEAKEVMRPIGG